MEGSVSHEQFFALFFAPLSGLVGFSLASSVPTPLPLASPSPTPLPPRSPHSPPPSLAREYAPALRKVGGRGRRLTPTLTLTLTPTPTLTRTRTRTLTLILTLTQPKVCDEALETKQNYTLLLQPGSWDATF